MTWLVRDVTRGAAEAGRDHLLIHAAGVQDGMRGVLLPGPSGSGKSTLAAGLVRSGLAYLSDELVALEVGSGHLLPYAKPISLKRGSFGVLYDMVPLAPRRADDGSATPEMLVAVGTSVGRLVGMPVPARAARGAALRARRRRTAVRAVVRDRGVRRRGGEHRESRRTRGRRGAGTG